MKVKTIRCHELVAAVEKPFMSARGWLHSHRTTLLVEVETEDGIVGWGESFGPATVCRSIVESLLAPRLVGRDPFDAEIIWDETYNRLKDYGAAGIVVAAMSALDIALWDIKGKSVGLPVCKLLGGRMREDTVAYATGFYFKDFDRVVPDAVEEAERYVNAGFRSLKMKIGLGDINKDAERVAAVRQAVGDEIGIMVDANHCFNVPDAIRVGRKLQELGVGWFEEPVSPEDLPGYAEVARALDMPIAGGENKFTRYEFRAVLEHRAMDIVQPDICTAGGFSELKKIAALASSYSVQCVPHAWGSAVALSATLQFIATLLPTPLSLFSRPIMLEFEQTPNPLREDLAIDPIVQCKGQVSIPSRPGLGIEVNRTIVDRYRVN